jgi:hypothetical protein
MKMQRKPNPFHQWERTPTEAFLNIINLYEVLVKNVHSSQKPKKGLFYVAFS